MTPREMLEHHKDAWQRQIEEQGVERHDAIVIVALAELNGLFDVHKAAFFNSRADGAKE